MTCLVINKKKMLSTDICCDKIKIPVKGKETKRKIVKCYVHCVKYTPNMLQVRIVSVCCCHRFGRKKVLFLTVALHALTTLLQAASVNWIMFGILNLFRGYSQNFSVSHILGKARDTWTWFLLLLRLPLNSCLCFHTGSELLGKYSRVTFSLIGHCCGFSVGYAMLPLLAFFMRSWRMLVVASAIPSLLLLPLWWWVVSWLMLFLFCLLFITCAITYGFQEVSAKHQYNASDCYLRLLVVRCFKGELDSKTMLELNLNSTYQAL